MATNQFFWKNLLTGGGENALDGIESAGLATGFVCFTIKSTTFYLHLYDSTSSAAESSPGVITPDDIGAGNGRWLEIDKEDYLLVSEIDDTPVDGETNAPISSNWANDHAVDTDIHSRAWSWSDEQTWDKHFILPVHGTSKLQKYSSNPVVGYGGYGTWDENGVAQPNAVLVDNVIYTYYQGFDSTYADYRSKSIGLVTVPISDIESTNWTKHGSNPLISAANGTWEDAAGSTGLASPAVLYDKDAPNTGVDYKWKMWYVGSQSSAAGSRIGYAYSSDGISWTKYVSNPVLAHAFGDGINQYPAIDVVMIGRVLYLSYRNAAGSISLCYSTDFVNFTNIGIILSVGAGGSWDDAGIFFPHFYHSQGTIYITYGGSDGANVKTGMACISVADFLTTSPPLFSKFIFNPILSSANPGTGAWDSNRNYPGLIIQVNDIYYIIFDANSSGATNRRIGLAWIKPEE